MTTQNGLFAKVETRVWGDDKFLTLSSDGKLLWFYLLTGPRRILAPGLTLAGVATIAEDLCWDDPYRVRVSAEEIESRGMATFDWVHRLIWVPNAIRYNTDRRPWVIRAWRKHFNALPRCPLWDTAEAVLRAAMEEASIHASRAWHLLPPLGSSEEGDREGEGEGDREGKQGTPKLEPFPQKNSLTGSKGENIPLSGEEQSTNQPQKTGTQLALIAPEPENPKFTMQETWEMWNQLAERCNLPKILRLGTARSSKLRSRFQEHPTREFWVQVFEQIGKTPFLLGENNRGWVVSFDYLIANDTNMTRILEGGFMNRQPPSPLRRKTKELPDGF